MKKKIPKHPDILYFFGIYAQNPSEVTSFVVNFLKLPYLAPPTNVILKGRSVGATVMFFGPTVLLNSYYSDKSKSFQDDWVKFQKLKAFT